MEIPNAAALIGKLFENDTKIPKIENLIQENATILPPGVFMPVLTKIHNRDR